MCLSLLMVCNGCFTIETSRFCERCHDDIRILERHGEISKDGTSLSVYLKKQTDFYRDPFKIWTESIVEESSHVYPLTAPEPGSIRKEFVVIFRNDDGRLHSKSFGIKSNSEALSHSNQKEKIDCLSFPSFHIYPMERKGSFDHYSTIDIHPDDLPLLSHPFVWEAFGRYVNNSFVIPYKLENNVCHAYVPKVDLVGQREMLGRPNMVCSVLKVVLLPPAFVMDVVTSPIQAGFILWALAHFNVN